jgi:polysaccharide pyruvyl transferase WcaK-like protein
MPIRTGDSIQRVPRTVGSEAGREVRAEARIVIVGAAGFTNLGDDAILTAMLAELRAAFAGAHFTVAGGVPAELPVAEDVTPIPLDIGFLDAALSRADLAIVGGGGFLYDYDGILSPHDLLRGDATFMYPYLRAALCARARNVPLFFYGLGVESLVTPVGRALTRDVLSLADAITVRDELSLRELRDAGVSGPVEVTADPAVRLDPPATSWPSRPAGRVIGFVPRLWLRFSGAWTHDAEERFERYCAWLAAAADHACDVWQATPVFLAGQRYNDDDLEAGELIIARMRHGERAVLLAAVESLESYHAVLASLDLLVSTRLHPMILAATAGVPTVGVVVSAKIVAFLARLGLEHLAVWPWGASGQQLCAALDSCFREGEELRARLRDGIVEQRAAARRNPELAARLVAAA